jgi:hypothetical protein
VAGGLADGRGVDDGLGLADGRGVADGLADGLAEGLGLADGLGVGPVTLVVNPVRQVTVAPPPLPEPLHWLTVTTSIELVVEFESTLHCTRCVPPPPLPDELHWVTAAPVVFDGNGSHRTVGAVPPPVPDALH